jgi:ribonuclease I
MCSRFHIELGQTKTCCGVRSKCRISKTNSESNRKPYSGFPFMLKILLSLSRSPMYCLTQQPKNKTLQQHQ